MLKQLHPAVAAALGIAAGTSAFALWLWLAPKPAPVGAHVEATPAKEVRRIGKESIETAPVQVYKPAAKEKLELPAVVKSSPTAHVVAATTTPNDERQHTVTTVLDSSTGEFTTFTRAEPLPWVAVSTKSEVGAYLGLKNGEPALRVEGRQELLQIKAVRIGARASADLTQSGHVDTFIGVGAHVRW